MMTRTAGAIFEGISEVRGGLSKGHVGPLNNKISLQI